MQRRRLVLVHRIDRRIRVQQQFGTFGLTVSRCAIQRRPQVIIPGLDARPRRDQRGHDPRVAVDAGQVQGRVRVRVLVVDGEPVTVRSRFNESRFKVQNLVTKIELSLKSLELGDSLDLWDQSVLTEAFR